MNYEMLRSELAKTDYAELSDAEAAARLNDATTTQIVSRFGSFRTLANLLTEEEYVALRTALDQLAQQNRRVADMVKMLELPGDDRGNGGGIDFGVDATRDQVDQVCATAEIPAAAAKIKAYAEVLQSWAQLNGFPGGVNVAQVHLARQPQE